MCIRDRLGFHDEKGKVFEIAIQTGAMLAVVWEYRARFAHALTGLGSDPVARRFVFNLAVAFIPVTSRSGATIIGGMLFGLSRRAATEFSFFLAVPTLVAAGAYDLYKHRALFDASDIGIFAVGMAVSFICAFACVRWLLRYIANHDFTPFAWYRIVFGLIVLGTGYFGLVSWHA